MSRSSCDRSASPGIMPTDTEVAVVPGAERLRAISVAKVVHRFSLRGNWISVIAYNV